MRIWCNNYKVELVAIFEILIQNHPYLTLEDFKEFCELIFLKRIDNTLN